MSYYREVVIETYKNTRGGSSKSIRAKPIAGQGLDTTMNVECSSSMRKRYPIGTLILLEAKIANKEGGPDFLYAHFESPYRVLSADEAKEFLRTR